MENIESNYENIDLKLKITYLEQMIAYNKSTVNQNIPTFEEQKIFQKNIEWIRSRLTGQWENTYKEFLDSLVGSGLFADFEDTNILEVFYNSFEDDDEVNIEWEEKRAKYPNYTYRNHKISIPHMRPDPTDWILYLSQYGEFSEEIENYLHEKIHSFSRPYIDADTIKFIASISFLLIFLLIPGLNILTLKTISDSNNSINEEKGLKEAIAYRATSHLPHMHTPYSLAYTLVETFDQNKNYYDIVKAGANIYDTLMALDFNQHQIAELINSPDLKFDHRTQTFPAIEETIANRLKELNLDQKDLQKIVRLRNLKREYAFLNAQSHAQILVRSYGQRLINPNQE